MNPCQHSALINLGGHARRCSTCGLSATVQWFNADVIGRRRARHAALSNRPPSNLTVAERRLRLHAAGSDSAPSEQEPTHSTPYDQAVARIRRGYTVAS